MRRINTLLMLIGTAILLSACGSRQITPSTRPLMTPPAVMGSVSETPQPSNAQETTQAFPQQETQPQPATTAPSAKTTRQSNGKTLYGDPTAASTSNAAPFATASPNNSAAVKPQSDQDAKQTQDEPIQEADTTEQTAQIPVIQPVSTGPAPTASTAPMASPSPEAPIIVTQTATIAPEQSASPAPTAIASPEPSAAIDVPEATLAPASLPSTPAPDAQPTPSAKTQQRIYLNGYRLRLENPAQEVAGQIMIPMAEVASYFSRKITCSQAGDTLTINDETRGNVVTLTAGKAEASLNGSGVSLQETSFMTDTGVLMVDVTAMASLLDAECSLIPEYMSVYITESGLC